MLDVVGSEERNSIRYLYAVRNRWHWVVLAVAIAVGAAVAYSMLTPKRYRAEADILITPVSVSDDTFVGLNVLRDTGGQTLPILTATRLMSRPRVAVLAARRLGVPNDWRGVLGAVNVKPISQSNIAAIVAEAGSAEKAAAIANAFAHAALEDRKAQFQAGLTTTTALLRGRLQHVPVNSGEAVALETRLAALVSLRDQGDPTISLLTNALPPGSPSWPRPTLSVVVAALAALFWGIGGAIAAELLGSRITSEEELQLRQRLPVLARVPRLAARNVRGYLTHDEPLPSTVWESYRTLRAALAVTGNDGEFPHSILVTSAIAGEGKTMTSANLAITIAMSGAQVVLVDGDLRRPMVATVFGVPPRRHGFASLLLGTVSPKDALVQAPGQPNLRLLLASPEQAHFVDILAPGRVREGLRQLSEHADVVVIDSPPITEVADALALADTVDTTLIAVRLGHSRRDRLVKLRQMLAQQGVAVAGFVVTSRQTAQRSSYYYDRAVGLHDVTAPEAVASPQRKARTSRRVRAATSEDAPTA